MSLATRISALAARIANQFNSHDTRLDGLEALRTVYLPDSYLNEASTPDEWGTATSGLYDDPARTLRLAVMRANPGWGSWGEGIVEVDMRQAHISLRGNLKMYYRVKGTGDVYYRSSHNANSWTEWFKVVKEDSSGLTTLQSVNVTSGATMVNQDLENPLSATNLGMVDQRHNRSGRVAHISDFTNLTETLAGGASTSIKNWQGWRPDIDGGVGEKARIWFAIYFASFEGSGGSSRFDVVPTEVGWRWGRTFNTGNILRVNLGCSEFLSGTLTVSDEGLQVELRFDAVEGWQARMVACDGVTLSIGAWQDFPAVPAYTRLNYFRVRTTTGGNLKLIFTYTNSATEHVVLDESIPSQVMTNYGTKHSATIELENYAQTGGTSNLGRISQLYYKF